MLPRLAIPIAQAVERVEETVRLGRPATLPLQRTQQCLILGIAVPRAVLDLQIIFERLQPLLITITVTHAGIQCAPRISPELCWTLGGGGKPFSYSARTEQCTQST